MQRPGCSGTTPRWSGAQTKESSLGSAAWSKPCENLNQKSKDLYHYTDNYLYMQGAMFFCCFQHLEAHVRHHPKLLEHQRSSSIRTMPAAPGFDRKPRSTSSAWHKARRQTRPFYVKEDKIEVQGRDCWTSAKHMHCRKQLLPLKKNVELKQQQTRSSMWPSCKNRSECFI